MFVFLLNYDESKSSFQFFDLSFSFSQLVDWPNRLNEFSQLMKEKNNLNTRSSIAKAGFPVSFGLDFPHGLAEK